MGHGVEPWKTRVVVPPACRCGGLKWGHGR